MAVSLHTTSGVREGTPVGGVLARLAGRWHFLMNLRLIICLIDRLKCLWRCMWWHYLGMNPLSEDFLVYLLSELLLQNLRKCLSYPEPM